MLVLFSSATILPKIEEWNNDSKALNDPAQSPFTLRDSEKKYKKTDEKSKTNEEKEKYPLLKDVYHPNKNSKEYFKQAAEQLKKGHFDTTFIRGLLLYGPPGTGKTEIVEAVANESGSTLFKIKASGLVTQYQGSGARAIQDVFQEAKDSENSAIIFIDELQNLAPATADQEVNFAHKYDGQDYRSTLSQLWTEYDDIKKNHSNILLVTACNEFELIEKRVRQRFECIEFPLPDKDGVVSILKNKSEHFDLPISESELNEYAKKMTGANGRRLTNFIKKTKGYTNSNMTLKEALQQSFADQQKAIKDAEPKGPSFIEKAGTYAWDSGKKVHDSALAALGIGIVYMLLNPNKEEDNK